MHEAHNEQMKALPSVWPMTKGGFFTKFHDVIKKISGSLGFFIKKRNDVSKKELFSFISIHDPQSTKSPRKSNTVADNVSSLLFFRCMMHATQVTLEWTKKIIKTPYFA